MTLAANAAPIQESVLPMSMINQLDLIFPVAISGSLTLALSMLNASVSLAPTKRE